MPLRGEFETEFENDAEVAIKDMIFTEDDTPAERQLKFTMLDIYSMVLDRRAARREFCFSHGLTDLKRHQSVDKSRSKDEREIYNMLKPFSRFISSEDLQRLLDGLTREEELRRQISHLQELRRHGIRSFDEVSPFESEKKHLELYLKGGSTIMGGSQTKTNAPIEEPFPLPTPAKFSKSMTSAQATPVPTTISIPRPMTSDSSNVPTPSVTPVNGSIPLAPASSGGRKASTPLNISHAEGVELLSEKERHLCSILRLYPRLYLSIKDTLIREYLKLGGLKRAQARAAVKIDVNKTSKLYDFFVAAGWIKPPASGE
jgi:transcriptional adapter 2-alpha